MSVARQPVEQPQPQQSGVGDQQRPLDAVPGKDFRQRADGAFVEIDFRQVVERGLHGADHGSIGAGDPQLGNEPQSHGGTEGFTKGLSHRLNTDETRKQTEKLKTER